MLHRLCYLWVFTQLCIPKYFFLFPYSLHYGSQSTYQRSERYCREKAKIKYQYFNKPRKTAYNEQVNSVYFLLCFHSKRTHTTILTSESCLNLGKSQNVTFTYSHRVHSIYYSQSLGLEITIVYPVLRGTFGKKKKKKEGERERERERENM